MLSRIAYFGRETVISLRRNLLMTLAGILTVAVSLSLFGGILMLSRWVGHGTDRWKDGVELQIFMNAPVPGPEATDDQIADVRTALAAWTGVVRSFEFLNKEDARREAERLFADDPVTLSHLTPDVLPVSFKVVPEQAELTPEIKERFLRFAGVESILTPDESLRWLLTVTRTVRWIFFALSTVLLASSLFLIVNTIRLATFARRREIEVMKLVGASNSFVRVPFMAEGLVQGLLGAGIAFVGVVSLKLAFDRWRVSDGFFQGYYLTSSDALTVGVGVLLLGAVIGLLGAFIGLWRFLRV